MDSIEQYILERVRFHTDEDVTLSDSLAIVGIDSVTMAELTFELERHFKIRVGDDVVQVETIGELVEYVRERYEK